MNLRRFGTRAMPLAVLGLAGMLAISNMPSTGLAARTANEDDPVQARVAARADLRDLSFPGATGEFARLVREATFEASASPFLGAGIGLTREAASGLGPLAIEPVAGRTRSLGHAVTSEPLAPLGAGDAERQSSRITREAIVSAQGVTSDVVDHLATRGAFAGSAARSRGASGATLDLTSVQDPLQPSASTAGLGREAGASLAAAAFRLSWPDDSVALGLAGKEAMPVPAEPGVASETERQAIKASVQNVDLDALSGSISNVEREAAQRAASIVATAALADAALPFERQAARDAAGLDFEAGAMITRSSLEREASISVAGSRSLEGLTSGSSIQPEGATGIEREASTSGQGALNDAAASARDAGRATLEEAMQ
jgi:hypothetical protein